MLCKSLDNRSRDFNLTMPTSVDRSRDFNLTTSTSVDRSLVLNLTTPTFAKPTRISVIINLKLGLNWTDAPNNSPKARNSSTLLISNWCSKSKRQKNRATNTEKTCHFTRHASNSFRKKEFVRTSSQRSSLINGKKQEPPP